MANAASRFSIWDGDRHLGQHTIEKNIIKVGRNPDADLCINDPACADMHATIEVRDGGDVTLIDLGNEPATLVNGVASPCCTLREGDQIQIGSCLVVFEDLAQATTVVPARHVAPELEIPSFADRPSPFAAATTHSPFAQRSQSRHSADFPEESYAYQMLRSGPDVSPSEVELPTETVEVTVLWGRNVLTTRHLGPEQSFWVGEDTSKERGVDFFLPSEKLETTRMPVVTRRPDGVHVVIPQTARGSVERDGHTPLPLDAVRGSGSPSVELAGAVEWHLPAHTEVRIEMHDVTFVVRSVNAGRPVPHGIGSELDWNSAAYFGASFLSFGALLATAAFFMPPMGLTTGELTIDEQALLILPYMDALAEKEQEPDQSTTESNDQNEGGTGERATGEEGAMGKQDSSETNKRYAIKGEPENPDPHLAREQALREAAEFGIIGILSSGIDTDPDAPTAPWGRETSLGLDEMSAMGNMWGDEIGEAAGSGGLGLTGGGQGAGGIGFGIGLGKIGTFGHGEGLGPGQGIGNGHGRFQGGHKVTSPKMRTGNPSVSGRLPPQVIQRIVRQNFGRFRLCYEKGLTANPNLEGRVAVRFVIDRNGAVSNAANGGTSMPSAEVTDCVVRASCGLSFPKPEGGIVTVQYPIAFSPG